MFAVSHSGEWEDESASLTARMSNGALVGAVLGVHSTNELDLYGPAGTLSFSFYRFDSLTYVSAGTATDGLGLRLRNLTHAIRQAPRGVLRLRRGGDFIESYQAEWRHFHDVIRHGVPVACTLDDGRRALHIALASVKSASRSASRRILGGRVRVGCCFNRCVADGVASLARRRCALAGVHHAALSRAFAACRDCS